MKSSPTVIAGADVVASLVNNGTVITGANVVASSVNFGTQQLLGLML
jgi:ADP-glucose pyrophosphorylase